MNRRTACILMAGLLFAGLSWGQTPSVERLISAKNEENRRGSRGQDDVQHVSRTINRVERAFEAGDPDELEQCLSTKKIYVSLKARGDEAGYYGRSQVKYMFRRLFGERRTDSFTYHPEDVEVSGGESARFHAEWSYVGLKEDDVVTEQLRFKLDRATGPNGDDWQVSEIRSQSR